MMKPDKSTGARTRPSKGTTRILRAVAVSAVIVLLAAGCGGADEENGSARDTIPDTQPTTTTTTTTTMPPEEALADEIVEALAAEALVPRPEEQLRCVAEAAIEAVGVEELIAAGAPGRGTFDGTLLDSKAQELLLDEALACIDLGSILRDPDVTGTAIASESVSCLVDEIERTGLAEKIVRAAVADGPERALADNLAAVVETMSTCLNLQEIAAVVDAFGLTPLLSGE